jgi:hypothetical protein
MIEDFINSPECNSRALCGSCLTLERCRAEYGGENWETEIGPMGTCPHGSEIDAPAPPIDPDALFDAREPVCICCDNLGCLIKPLADCKRRKNLNDPQFQCPDGRF